MPRLQLAVLVLLVQVPAAARSQDVINVLDRGAVPNDPRPAAAAANWTAFRGAISALTATGRAGTIYFPGGNTYYFTDGDLGAVVRPVAGAAGITIRGDGMSSVVRPVTGSGSAASFVNLQGSVNLRIQDLSFYAWNHVVHDAAGGFWIDGLFTGNWLTGCGAEGAIRARLVSLRIQENVWDVLHGPAIVAKPGSEYGVIQGNLFYDQNNLVANGRTSLPTIDLAGTNFDVRASAVQQWDISGNVFYQSVQMGEPVQDALRAIKVNGARGILVNITSTSSFTMDEYYGVMNTIKGFTAEDATVIIGNVVDEAMGDSLRVTMVATGLGAARPKKEAKTEMRVVEQFITRTGTDAGGIETINYEDLDAPAVMRRGRRESGAPAAAVGMDALEIPAFLRKQAD